MICRQIPGAQQWKSYLLLAAMAFRARYHNTPSFPGWCPGGAVILLRRVLLHGPGPGPVALQLLQLQCRFLIDRGHIGGIRRQSRDRWGGLRIGLSANGGRLVRQSIRGGSIRLYDQVIQLPWPWRIERIGELGPRRE